MFLVIGYGNELRRDDGIGPRVARAVADWDIPGVRALAVHQLTPELAVDIAQAKEVVFVDVAANSGTSNVSIQPVRVVFSNSLANHVSSVRPRLLALVEVLATSGGPWRGCSRLRPAISTSAKTCPPKQKRT